jgi:hypothetical protein
MAKRKRLRSSEWRDFVVAYARRRRDGIVSRQMRHRTTAAIAVAATLVAGAAQAQAPSRCGDKFESGGRCYDSLGAIPGRSRICQGRAASFKVRLPHRYAPSKRAGGDRPLRIVRRGPVITTTLRREAIHAADHLPDSELGPCLAAAAHRWDHPADRAAA